jgi:hypothetical protein
MTKNVSVALVCALASMAGIMHPIPIAIVDRPRIAFNIFYSLEGRGFARKLIQTSSLKATLKQDPLCAQILEMPKGERLQARA